MDSEPLVVLILEEIGKSLNNLGRPTWVLDRHGESITAHVHRILVFVERGIEIVAVELLYRVHVGGGVKVCVVFRFFENRT